MKHGKYEKIPPKRQKNVKSSLVLLCLVLTFCLSVGGTLAFVLGRSNSITNLFKPAQVSCSVDDDDLSITNTGNVDAYIRAAVVVNWMDENGNISGTKPTNADYTITYDSNAWSEDGGIYYYYSSVDPGETVKFVTVTDTGKVNESYKLVAEVVAEAIQAEGMGEDIDTAQEAWAAALTRPNNG